MAKGKDERFNPNRNPKNPFASDEEAIDYLMQAFPGSKMVEPEQPTNKEPYSEDDSLNEDPYTDYDEGGYNEA